MGDRIMKPNSIKQNIRKNFSSMLELPKEITLNFPLITIVGNEDFTIENHKGILEYSSGRVKLTTECGVLKIEGSGLILKEITSENLSVTGKIQSLEFLL